MATNSKNIQPGIDKIYLSAKDPYEAKYSSDMDDIYKGIEEYNPNKKSKILIVFDGSIADMLSNKKLNLIVTELFIGGRKLKISFVFITQSYVAVAKNIRLYSTHYFIMKISNKQERN